MIEKRCCQNCGDPYWVRRAGSRRWCPFCESRLALETPAQLKARTERANIHRVYERGPDAGAESDKEETRAGRGRFRSGYRHLIGGDAPWCGPRDVQTAKRFLRLIEHAQDMAANGDGDGGFGLSKSERGRLAALHKKWLRRSQGKDARFNLVGNRRGGLTQEQERAVVWERLHIRNRCD